MTASRSRWSGRAGRGRLVALVILIVGWTIAAVVYLRAQPVPESADVDDLLHSKPYTRELERVGGKADVLANDLNDWLASLWEGKTRAYTIACLTALAAGATVIVTRDVGPSDDGS